VTLDTFGLPANQRFFEDYKPGQVYEFGSITVSEQDIVDFARQFDPQYFHIDPVKAAAGPYKGIIASGWHTISVAMRLYVKHYLPDAASLGSPGVDEVRWPIPMRPGDTLRIRISILEARSSRSRPDRGIVRAHVEAITQNDEVVLTMNVVSLIGRRGSSSSARAD
jgi:acyl dehydratase